MLDGENQIEYLERNIAEISTSIGLLENKPWGVSIGEDIRKLRNTQYELTKELCELRPYKIIDNGANFIIAHNGDFVCNDDRTAFLYFDSQSDAQAWIDQQ